MASEHASMLRRRLLTLLGSLGLASPLALKAQPATRKLRPKSPPVWTGFGLNGGHGQARYNLTRGFIRNSKSVDLSDSVAFADINQKVLTPRLKALPQLVQFKSQVEFGEDLLLGFAHDYETTVGARIERDGQNANTLIVFMSGVGLILGFDRSSGWRIVSSFPFMLRMERPGGDLRNIQDRAVAVMDQAYQSYGNAFAEFLKRFNRWDQGFSTNFFARLTKASIHKDAAEQLQRLRVNQVYNEEFLGFSASTAICDNLNIPLLPYQENDALGKRYAVKFSDDLTAQAEISIPDADLRFEVVLRHIDKKLTTSSQRGVTIVRRNVVLRLMVYDEFSSLPDKRLLNVLAESAGEDRLPLDPREDDTPERDLVMFDRLISRTLSNLLQGLATRSEQALAAVEVKLSFVAPALPRLMELCAKTRS